MLLILTKDDRIYNNQINRLLNTIEFQTGFWSGDQTSVIESSFKKSNNIEKTTIWSNPDFLLQFSQTQILITTV